jgi:hypothetical protein
LPDRRKISNQVIWPVDQKNLKFGTPFIEILKAFEAIEQNQISKSVKIMAEHEQWNILQSAIYDSFLMRRALDANQFSWATGFPNGAAAEIKLTLSAECDVKTTWKNVWFSKDSTAQLYEQNERMALVNLAAARFNYLLHSTRASQIEASISEIAVSGAVK